MPFDANSCRYALIIPALNEEGSIDVLLRAIPKQRFRQVLVVDNGSTDGTSVIARAADAEVVSEPRRGYGQACWAGIAALRPEIDAIAFMGADLSDDPGDLAALLDTFESGSWEMVIGSRELGSPEPGSLTVLQRFGNGLATRLIDWLWGVRFTDLGPLRVIRRNVLDQLALRDRGFGWTVEMQARAAQRHLRVTEFAAHYRRRRAGRSKISGTVIGSVRAGVTILWTIGRCWWGAGNTAR